MHKVINPFDQSVVGQIEFDTADSIQSKLARAKVGFQSQSFGTLDERCEQLRRFAQALQANAEEDAQLLSRQTGKPVKQALSEIKATDARLKYFIETLPELIQTRQTVMDESVQLQEQVSYEPLGIIANISAWNYPYFVGLNVIAPALLAGNVVAYKGSEWCPLTCQRIAEGLWQAGFSQDQMVLITGDGEQGQSLLAADIDGVFFTGSVQTGKAIAQQVASKLIPMQLELGGKDPVYVTDDVDAAIAAAQVADGAFYNTGQSCCAVERIYVHAAIAPQFIEAFVREVARFKVGDPSDETTYIGPLTRPSHIEFLRLQVEDALKKGALLALGGTGQSDGFFAPTVLTKVDHTMLCMKDESFGPLVGIQVVKDDAEAQALMNDTEYGLTAGVFCHDKARAQRILAKLDAGTVYINACDRVSPFSPWSGRRNSGIGATLSHEGIRCFVRPKAWHIRG